MSTSAGSDSDLMSTFETFEHAGVTVKLYYEEHDTEHANPRSDDGNLGVMFCDYSGYKLGDADAPDPRDQRLQCERCEGSGEDPDGRYIVSNARAYGVEIVKVDFTSLASAERYIERNAPEDSHWQAEPQSCPVCEGECDVEVSMIQYLKREHGARVIMPLFVYEHSGITMSVGGRLDTGEDNLVSRGRFNGDGAGWDTSAVGMIFDTTESREACGWVDGGEHILTDEQIVTSLEEEVRYYAAYLEGQVYGYDIIGPDGETIGGCGGFLEPDIHKEDSYVREEARSEAESCAREIKREAELVFEWACRDVVTV